MLNTQLFPNFDPDDVPVDIFRPRRLVRPPPPAPGELQLTDDFMPLLTRQARYKVYYGGRGSAKSTSVAKALIWLAARVKIRVLCTREIQKSIAESVHAMLRAEIENMGYADYFRVTQNSIKSTMGSEFIFMGLRSDVSEIKSTYGINIVWVEEAQAVSEFSWDILTKTIRKTSDTPPEIWVTFNAFEEDDATYKLFVKGKKSIERHFPGSYVKLVNWDRNPWFPEDLELERQADLSRIEDAVDEGGRMSARMRVEHIWEGRIHRLPSGSFFSLGSMLIDGRAAGMPLHPTCVFATIDTAMKTGQENDGCGVVYWAVDLHNVCEYPLYILDWEYKQIDGALLINWLPSVFQKLDYYANECKAIAGTRGAHIEDKSSGTILLQQALNLGLEAYPIESKLTAMGKSERCLDVSGYVHLGQVKLTEFARAKTVNYKGVDKNHLVAQIVGFDAAVKVDRNAQDDLLDAFSYGLALAFGNSLGF
jgi:hypothetical protein